MLAFSIDGVTNVDQVIESFINYGIAGLVILAFFWATIWLGKRLFGTQGLLVKLADQHMEFVTHLRITQDCIQKAIECSNELQQRIVTMNEESIHRLEEFRQNDPTTELIHAARGHLKVLRLIVHRLDIEAESDIFSIESALERIKRD